MELIQFKNNFNDEKVNNKKNQLEGILLVNVIRGINLMAADLNGLSDPYCKLIIGNQHEKTEIKRESLNPIWNNNFIFRLKNPSIEILEI